MTGETGALTSSYTFASRSTQRDNIYNVTDQSLFKAAPKSPTEQIAECAKIGDREQAMVLKNKYHIDFVDFLVAYAQGAALQYKNTHWKRG